MLIWRNMYLINCICIQIEAELNDLTPVSVSGARSVSANNSTVGSSGNHQAYKASTSTTGATAVAAPAPRANKSEGLVHKTEVDARAEEEEEDELDMELDDLELDQEDIYQEGEEVGDLELDELDLEEVEEEEEDGVPAKQSKPIATAATTVSNSKSSVSDAGKTQTQAQSTGTADTRGTLSRDVSGGTMSTAVMISSHPSSSTNSK